jgi:predicted kinase
MERQGRVVRFSHDEWMRRLHGANPPAELFERRAKAVSEVIWLMAQRVLNAGMDVVLDMGFWTRRSREDARSRIEASGASSRLYVFDTPLHHARERVVCRTSALPEDCLWIDGATFDVLAARFEPVGEDEARLLVHGQADGTYRVEQGNADGAGTCAR